VPLAVAGGSGDTTHWSALARCGGTRGLVFGGGDAGAHLDMTRAWQYFTSPVGASLRDKQLLPHPGGSRTFLTTGRPARLFGLPRSRHHRRGPCRICVFIEHGSETKVTMRDDLPGRWRPASGVQGSHRGKCSSSASKSCIRTSETGESAATALRGFPARTRRRHPRDFFPEQRRRKPRRVSTGSHHPGWDPGGRPASAGHKQHRSRSRRRPAPGSGPIARCFVDHRSEPPGTPFGSVATYGPGPRRLPVVLCQPLAEPQHPAP